MNYSISLADYIGEWMETYKRTTVKQSTFERLQTSVTALEGHSIGQREEVGFGYTAASSVRAFCCRFLILSCCVNG